jgi:hypothetical protein
MLDIMPRGVLLLRSPHPDRGAMARAGFQGLMRSAVPKHEDLSYGSELGD